MDLQVDGECCGRDAVPGQSRATIEPSCWAGAKSYGDRPRMWTGGDRDRRRPVPGSGESTGSHGRQDLLERLLVAAGIQGVEGMMGRAGEDDEARAITASRSDLLDLRDGRESILGAGQKDDRDVRRDVGDSNDRR